MVPEKVPLFNYPEWIATVADTMGWIYQLRDQPEYRRHLSNFGHYFGNWANAELLARSQRRAERCTPIREKTWVVVQSRILTTLKQWATPGTLGFLKHFTSDEAISDASETVCLRLVLCRNMVAY